ncbi:MAG: cell division protein FtsL [Pseudomonadota bacterium]
MRTILFVLTTLSVIGLAFWAYHENHATREALNETERLHHQIQTAHTRLAVLRAEWAYLNRPDRLRELADLNFDRLGLFPLHPDQFGHVSQVAFPPDPDLSIVNAVEVANLEGDE